MMKIFDTLNRKNFEMFAAQNYTNPECLDVEEFKEDLARFKYLKRLLRRYELTGDLQERLILNHLIVIYNVFGIPSANRMIEYKIEDIHWPYIKPFLVLLHYLPEDYKVEIPMDINIVDTLRKL
jgi:hypothetical protein|tara:strand:+ start:1104 stop:1475 length:372 start_codon:yes stop_codon:yes gene_type:complete